MVGVVGVTPASLHQRWQFGVTIDGFGEENALFQRADLPEITFDEVAFNPGGSMFPQKVAGRASFSDVTLEKGKFQKAGQTALYKWIKQCIDMANGQGVASNPTSYMKEVIITEYDRAGAVVRVWQLHNAWVKSCKFGELEGGSSENTIESITISYQWFDQF